MPKYDLKTGYPSLETVPKQRLQEIASQIILSGEGLQYGGDLLGIYSAREQIAHLLTDLYTLSVQPNELMLTSGALAAIDVACRMLTRPGDVVIVEDPTFFFVVNLFRQCYVEVVGVPLTDDGIDLDALEHLANEYGDRLRFIYTIPSYQNPTGVCASAANRAGLVELARRRHFHILEDSTYQPLYYAEPPPPPLKHYDAQGDIVLTVGSVSKVLMPALRVGWVWADNRHVAACRDYKMDAAASRLTNEIVAEYIRAGEMLPQIAAVRAFNQRKYQLMLDLCAEYLPEWLVWSKPEGGYFIWAELPENMTAAQVETIAHAHGVDFMRGSAAFVNPTTDRHLRLCFTYMEDDVLHDGVALLGQALSAAYRQSMR